MSEQFHIVQRCFFTGRRKLRQSRLFESGRQEVEMNNFDSFSNSEKSPYSDAQQGVILARTKGQKQCSS